VEPELDPLALLAALAALTSRSLVVAALPAPDRPLEALARTVATIAAPEPWPRRSGGRP
jgi:hypothetical protein